MWYKGIEKFHRHINLTASLAGVALGACAPQLKGVAAPRPHLLGAGEVVARGAGRGAGGAAGPVHGVYLPEADIVAAIGILVLSIGVSAALVLHDALAL